MLKLTVLAASILVLSAAAHADDSTPPGFLSGMVEVAPGLPAGSCDVWLEGSPIHIPCKSGGEILQHILPGTWVLSITVNGVGTRRITVAANAGQDVSFGTVLISHPGSISGRVIAPPGDSPEEVVIGVPELGIFTHPSAGGTYLLTGVVPGNHDVVAMANNSVVTRRTAQVLAGSLMQNIDLPIPHITFPPIHH